MDGNNKALYQFFVKFMDHFIILHLCTLLNSCKYSLFIIEISLHCYDKLTNFGTNTHKSGLYLLSFGCLLFSKEFGKKLPIDNKYNSGLYAYMQISYNLKQNYNETSIIIVCSNKNVEE